MQLPHVPLNTLLNDLLLTTNDLLEWGKVNNRKIAGRASTAFEILADQYRKGIRG
jgi:hypothetical protein